MAYMRFGGGSCWYIYANAEGRLTMFHAPASCQSDFEFVELDRDDAILWEAPEDCPLRDEATERVREFAAEFAR